MGLKTLFTKLADAVKGRKAADTYDHNEAWGDVSVLGRTDIRFDRMSDTPATTETKHSPFRSTLTSELTSRPFR